MEFDATELDAVVKDFRLMIETIGEEYDFDVATLEENFAEYREETLHQNGDEIPFTDEQVLARYRELYPDTTPQA